jgi:signal peptide peptidase-like protein 2B
MRSPYPFLLLTAATAADLPPFAWTEVSRDSGATFSPFSFAQVASFGPYLDAPTQPLRVVLASDSPWSFACSPHPRLPYPHVLLASRGNCTFLQKARSASSSGAALLIITDGLPGKYYPSFAAAPSGPLSAGQCDVDTRGFCFSVPASEVDLPHALAGWPSVCGGGRCASGLCALTGAPSSGDGARTACCVPDDNLVMGGGGGDGSLGIPPLLWLPAGAGTALGVAAGAARAGAPLLLRAGLRPVPSWDTSGLLMWALGVCAAAFASWGGAAAERRVWAAKAGYGGAAAGGAGGAAPPAALPSALEAAAGDTLSLTPRQALLLLAFASSFLLGLFLLLSLGVPIVWIVFAVFLLGAGSALASLVAAPLLSSAAPAWAASPREVSIPLPPLLSAWCGAGPSLSLRPPDVVAGALAGASVALWFALRHFPGAWVGQDFFGLLLCVHAVARVRLSSLRSAALLLWALFFYDVVMVFFTPYLFSGRSVMVDVATAGAPAPAPAGLPTPACYCRLHPEDASVCGPGETMPILFSVPRFGDWRGGAAMLGLGDIVVPAVALAVALRWDYTGGGRGGSGGGDARRGGSESGEDTVGLLVEGASGEGGAGSPRRRNGSAGAPGSSSDGGETVSLNSGAALVGALPSPGATPPLFPPRHAAGGPPLWAVGVCGYAVGLALAQLAVLWSGMGQPALLYLVPCVLLPVTALARARGELGRLWEGGLEVAAAPAGGGAAAVGVRGGLA